MSTKLFTVKTDDLAELATQIMLWKNIHHIPVECENGKICGILTWTHMQRFQKTKPHDAGLTVGSIMKEDVILAHAEMQIQEAIQIMKQNEIGCLPVVHNQHLIGIVTIMDIKSYDHSEGVQ